MLKKIVFVFAFAAFFASLFICASAETMYADVKGDSFLCESFFSQNALVSTDENGYLKMSFSRTSPVLSADIPVYTREAGDNAICLSLVNNSACNSMVITYYYLNEYGKIQSTSEKLLLKPRGIRSDYFVYIGNIERVIHMSIAFSGVISGSVTVMAMDICSVYQDQRDVCGTVDSCVYDHTERSIKISGTIKYEVVSSHRNARLVLYAVDMETTAFSYGSVPHASVPMSSRFEFLLSEVSLEQRMKAYIIAVVGEGGELLYSFVPRVPSSSVATEEQDGFWKGIHTDLGVLAAKSNAKLAVIDVDFQKLISPNIGEGYLYASNGKYFYFNRQYISVLDGEIKKSYENGMRVILRLVSSGISELGLSEIIAVSPEDRICLYAYTEFLCTRYRDSSRGVISGLIFGNCADDISLKELSFERYTRLYADSLFAVYEAAVSVEKNLGVIIPVSDFLDSGIRGSFRTSPRLFFASLGKILSERYVGGMNVGVMVESSALSGEGSLTQQLGFENIAEFSKYLKWLHDEHSMFFEHYLYYWNPKNTTSYDFLKASLIHGYCALASESEARGFVFSTDVLSDVSMEADLMRLFRFVDTSLGEADSGEALATLKLQGWQDVIEGYVKENVQTVKYREVADAAVEPFRYLGDCYLWDFSGLGNNYGWSAGDGCTSVVMEKNEQTNRALASKMVPIFQNNYESELIYRFDDSVSFAAVDTVSFLLRVDAPRGNYRITLQICGDDVVSESEMILSSGKLSTLYVNTADLFKQDQVKCIRIFTSPVSGETGEYKLSIGSILAHSTTQNNETLEKSIWPEENLLVPEETTRNTKRVWFYFAVVMVFVSAIVIVTLHFRSEEEI